PHQNSSRCCSPRRIAQTVSCICRYASHPCTRSIRPSGNSSPWLCKPCSTWTRRWRGTERRRKMPSEPLWLPRAGEPRVSLSSHSPSPPFVYCSTYRKRRHALPRQPLSKPCHVFLGPIQVDASLGCTDESCTFLRRVRGPA